MAHSDTKGQTLTALYSQNVSHHINTKLGHKHPNKVAHQTVPNKGAVSNQNVLRDVERQKYRRQKGTDELQQRNQTALPSGRTADAQCSIKLMSLGVSRRLPLWTSTGKHEDTPTPVDDWYTRESQDVLKITMQSKLQLLLPPFKNKYVCYCVYLFFMYKLSFNIQ